MLVLLALVPIGLIAQSLDLGAPFFQRGESAAAALPGDYPRGGAAAQHSSAAVSPASGMATVGAGRGIFRLGTSFRRASGYERFGYVVVGVGDAHRAARLPGTSLVYMSFTGVADGFSTGVPFDVALSRGMLVRGSDGELLRRKGFPYLFLGDVASAAYQREWIARVVSFLQRTGVDGVFIDDVIGDLEPWIEVGKSAPAYAEPGSWARATSAFVRAIGVALKRRGYYVLVNANHYRSADQRANDGSLTADWWQVLAPSVSGLMNEYWVQNPNDSSRLRSVGSEWFKNWEGWQRLVGVAQRAGTDFFGYMEGSARDVRAMRFGRGSFMLDWAGGGGAFIFQPRDADDPWHPAWTAEVGLPIGLKLEVQPGVWRRSFERAIVVVNATESSVTLDVCGDRTEVAATDALVVAC